MKVWCRTAAVSLFLAVTGGAAGQTTGSPANPEPTVFEIPSSGPSQWSAPELAEAPPATAAPMALTPPPGRRIPSTAPELAAGHPPPPTMAQRPAASPGNARNETCRDGTYAAMIDGKPKTVPARLCQQADGSWNVTPQ